MRVVLHVRVIFGEMLTRKQLLPGSTEIDQLEKIYQLCGTPTGSTAEVLSRCPGYATMQFEKTYPNMLPKKFEK